MHIVILTGIQNKRKKESYFVRNVLFEVYFSDEGHLYTIVSFIFCPLVLHAYSFRSVLVAYACTFPSEQGFKNDILAAKKWLYFATFEA